MHGEGYTDLNWLIPEAVGSVDIRKGPYFADVGDFENSGNLHINLRDTVEQPIEGVTVASFGYLRRLDQARRRQPALCRLIHQLARGAVSDARRSS
jgi:hypothetical protein